MAKCVIKIKGRNDNLLLYVDGSYNHKKKIYSYGVVIVDNDTVIHTISGCGNDEMGLSMRNVTGEVLASIHAVKYAKDNNYKNITICYDYSGIEHWALKTWKRNNKLTQYYCSFMQDSMKEINIKFVKIKSHSGDYYNEMVDKLAKEAIK